jgi:hypothetical protein
MAVGYKITNNEIKEIDGGSPDKICEVNLRHTLRTKVKNIKLDMQIYDSNLASADSSFRNIVSNG